MAPALLAGRTHLKEQQVENAIVSFLFLLLCCPTSVSHSVCLPWMGDGSNPDWQELWKIWQAPLSPTYFLSPLTLCCYRLERGHILDEKQVSQEKCESLYAFSWYQHQLPLSPLMSPRSFSLLTFHFCILSLSPLSLRLSGAALSLPFLSLCSLFTLGLPECVFAVC